jgi:hypothetical protein
MSTLFIIACLKGSYLVCEAEAFNCYIPDDAPEEDAGMVPELNAIKEY